MVATCVALFDWQTPAQIFLGIDDNCQRFRFKILGLYMYKLSSPLSWCTPVLAQAMRKSTSMTRHAKQISDKIKEAEKLWCPACTKHAVMANPSPNGGYTKFMFQFKVPDRKL